MINLPHHRVGWHRRVEGHNDVCVVVAEEGHEVLRVGGEGLDVVEDNQHGLGDSGWEHLGGRGDDRVMMESELNLNRP